VFLVEHLQYQVVGLSRHMRENTITQLPDPSGFSSEPFTEVIRDGALKLIEQAIHAELAMLMAVFSGE